MLLNALMIIAVYACFRIVEIAVREVRERRYFIPAMAALAVLGISALTYSSIKTSIDLQKAVTIRELESSKRLEETEDRIRRTEELDALTTQQQIYAGQSCGYTSDHLEEFRKDYINGRLKGLNCLEHAR